MDREHFGHAHDERDERDIPLYVVRQLGEGIGRDGKC
jgi:hypothetical protein